MTRRALAIVVMLACCTPVFAGGNPEITRTELELAWVDLLELARLRDEDSRQKVEKAQQTATHPALRKLADFLLAEWEVPKTDERFGVASLVWLPEIDFASLPAHAREVSFPGVVISGVVTPAGRLENIELVKSSGSALIDQAALDSAEKALHRPALADGSYRKSRAAITIHVDPR